MLSGDRAANGDAEIQNLIPGSNGMSGLLRISNIKQNQRVQIAVARVKNVADHQTMFGTDLLDMPESSSELGARDDSVLNVIRRRDPADRAERVLPSLPQPCPLFGIFGAPDLARSGLADISHRSSLVLDSFRETLQFNEQHGTRIHGIAGV